MLGNNLGWVAYGFMVQNPFLALANAPGLMVSIWLNLQAAKLQYEAWLSREPASPSAHDGVVIANVLLWMIVLTTLVFSNVSSDRQEFVLGMITIAMNVTFYASPLFGTVLRNRNASSIHGPTMLAMTMNGSFWSAYGFAVSDLFIAIPNTLGAGLGGIQILLYLLFPRTTEQDSITAVEAAR